MEMDFIPMDYDSFDYQGKNYAKIYGRNGEGRKICVIDSFEPSFWAILKEKLSNKKINKLIEKISKI